MEVSLYKQSETLEPTNPWSAFHLSPLEERVVRLKDVAGEKTSFGPLAQLTQHEKPCQGYHDPAMGQMSKNPDLTDCRSRKL